MKQWWCAGRALLVCEGPLTTKVLAAMDACTARHQQHPISSLSRQAVPRRPQQKKVLGVRQHRGCYCFCQYQHNS